MCVVVDANSRGRFLSGDKSATLLRDWVEKREGKLLHIQAGDWQTEHQASGARWQAQVRAYSGAGVLRIVADAAFNAALRSLPEKTKSGEKDRHILALALAGGARLLYSADGNLRDDFKGVVNGGKVYPGAGGESDSNHPRTVARCRKMLKDGGLCEKKP